MILNPWKILGVHKQSTEEEIHKAYIELARKHHPDKKDGSQHLFAELSLAHALLKDKNKLQAFISELVVMGKTCTPCKGSGATYKQRGLTERVATTCKGCDGMGVVLNPKIGTKPIVMKKPSKPVVKSSLLIKKKGKRK